VCHAWALTGAVLRIRVLHVTYMSVTCAIQDVTSSTQECYIFLTGVSHYTQEHHVSQDDPGDVQPPRSHISVWWQQLVLSELCVLINVD